MDNALDRFQPTGLAPSNRGTGRLVTSRRTNRTLTALDERTLLRLATVQAEGLVQTEKTREIDHLARSAMSGQTMLRRWVDTLAAGDPLIAEELRFFVDLARMGKGEIIADTIDTFCRESRRS